MPEVARSVEVFLPKMLPSTYLSPNRGERKVGRVPSIISHYKSEMRGDVCLGLLADDAVRAIGRPLDPARMTLTLRCTTARSGGSYRPHDAGNAIYALKAAIDGIKDAGLIVDDDLKHLVELTGRVERVNTADEEGLLVYVEEVC
jgi:hypothetical protein